PRGTGQRAVMPISARPTAIHSHAHRPTGSRRVAARSRPSRPGTGGGGADGRGHGCSAAHRANSAVGGQVTTFLLPWGGGPAGPVAAGGCQVAAQSAGHGRWRVGRAGPRV